MATATERMSRSVVTIGNAFHEMGVAEVTKEQAAKLIESVNAQIAYKAEQTAERLLRKEERLEYPISRTQAFSLHYHTGQRVGEIFAQGWKVKDYEEFMEMTDHSDCDDACGWKNKAA